MIIVISIFIAMFALCLLIVYLMEKMKLMDKTSGEDKIIIAVFTSFPLSLLTLFLGMHCLYEKNLSDMKNDLESEGYRYTKTISDDSKQDIRLNRDVYFLSICGNDSHKIVDEKYNEISISSHLFEEKDIYVYCKDLNMHRNFFSTDNLDDYEFLMTFPEYPSSQAISEHCDVNKAIILNNDMKAVSPLSPTFRNRINAYLYCEK